jgi:hypothetical protein
MRRQEPRLTWKLPQHERKKENAARREREIKPPNGIFEF